MESKTVAHVKSYVKSKLKSNILGQCPHHLIVGHNKNQLTENKNDYFNTQFSSERFQSLPFSSDLPKPLLPPSKVQRDFCGKDDASMQFIYTKIEIQNDINRYLDLYKKYSGTLNKHSKKNTQFQKKKKNHYTVLPRYLAETSTILECDPDSNFSGTYNWYYSGGTLNKIQSDIKDILVFPYAEELIVLPIELKEDSLFMPNFKSAVKMPITDKIFQIISCVSNNNGIILSRSKKKCLMYNIFNLKKTKLQLLKIHEQSSEIPYISIDLDSSNCNKYCTANINRVLTILDITQAKHVLSGKVNATKTFNDNWAFIKYDHYNNNILKYIDRHCVSYYDTRLPIERSVLLMCPKDYLEDCENLSSYIASCKSEYFSYVGSNHSLCLLDNRSPDYVVKKWTHQFKSSPLFSDVCFRENTEFIAIASHLPGESALVLNNWTSNTDLPESCSTPYSPPSNLETLSALQSQGKCLSPCLRNRLLLCNIGCIMTVHRQNENTYLFTQNSVNDVFYQGIGYHESLNLYSLENSKALYKLKIWERQILKHNCHNIVSPLVVTNRKSAFNVFRDFTNQIYHLNDDKMKVIEHLPRWKRSITELNSFIDIFAPEILAPWEISEESPLVPTSAPHMKVLSWLGMDNKNTDNFILKDSNDAQETVITESQNFDKFIEQDNESIQFLLPKKIPVVCSSTGVKHLHQEALKFDIGVYFEANGHGTVIFKGSAVKIIQTAANDKNLSESQQIAAYTIKNLINVINQTVGDALSDMLLVELILFSKDWDLITWENSYYDIPNKQVKIKIQNKNAITTTDAGRYCVTPKGLQERIDTIIAKYTNGRSFVRPSGTEDIVRIYAECEKDSDVQKLAAEVSLAVYELAGGIGVKPNIPV